MPHEVKWSVPALDDVDAIKEYIARDSIRHAEAMARGFTESADRLGDFPRMGRILPKWNDELLRELIIRPYRLVYEISDRQVVVLAVVHGARLLERAIGDRLPPPDSTGD